MGWSAASEVDKSQGRGRRALAVPTTACVLVAAPSQASLEDATHLGAQLADRLVPAHTILMNRAFVAFEGGPVTHRSGGAPPGVDGALLAALREEVADGNDAAVKVSLRHISEPTRPD